MKAALNGHADALKALAMCGFANADTKDNLGHTAVLWAVMTGSVRAVMTLLEELGADVYGSDSTTSLIVAITCGHKDLACALMDTRVNLDHQDKLGRTALMVVHMNL